MDINVKEMDMETLRALQAQIAAEIKARCSSNLVIYTHGCKDAAKHHLSKYKTGLNLSPLSIQQKPTDTPLSVTFYA